MIVFTKITIRNFMSVGNAPLTIEYAKHKTTLVTAANGAGKSSVMLDALTFVLYGFPYRDINKPQLINSVNNKGLVVELEFTSGKTKYRVVRGVKPNLFEIYKNGKLINQDAAIRDYQKVLENGILKMSYRTFSQVVIMGSGNYVPFMRLKTDQRREFVENVVDIRVFSTMNMLLKQKSKLIDEKIQDNNSEFSLVVAQIKMQESFIASMSTEHASRIAELNTKITNTDHDIESVQFEINQVQSEIDAIKFEDDVFDNITSRIQKLKSLQDRIQQNSKKCSDDKVFFQTIDVCPTCHQTVDDDHRSLMVKEVEQKINIAENGLAALIDKLASANQEMVEFTEVQRSISAKQYTLSTLNTTLATSIRLKQDYQSQITKIQTNTSSIDIEKTKLRDMAKQAIELKNKRTELADEKTYVEVAATMLKDTGIKAKMIKQYIPVINKMINHYLQQMELFVSFEFDENFVESVKSRHRDIFSYDSFSEGEKTRINLALMFMFRDVARLKNSANTNLLIMDEIMDQSLDAGGIDAFFKLIGGLDKTNLFVISHREGVEDKFNNTIKLTKLNNFTVGVETV